MTTKPESNKQITANRKATHDYFIEEKFEAGIALLGWEVKSLRAGRAQLAESHLIIKNNEIWLLGSHISPLISASTHVDPDPTRTRKILMHATEISRLIGKVEQKGYTLVPLSLYWKKGFAKIEIALAKGKKQHDKRASEKERDWDREKHRIMKNK